MGTATAQVDKGNAEIQAAKVAQDKSPELRNSLPIRRIRCRRRKRAWRLRQHSPRPPVMANMAGPAVGSTRSQMTQAAENQALRSASAISQKPTHPW
jgi:hypothetical protein